MNRKFFTLVELLSVIGLIAIVASIVLGGLSYAGRRADQTKTISLMTQLEMALDQFKLENGYYPMAENAEPVEFLLEGGEVKLQLGTEKFRFQSTTGGKKPYLELGTVSASPTEYLDAYGNAFQYKCPGTNNTSAYDLWSKGADGGSDNDDDISNWKRNQ